MRYRPVLTTVESREYTLGDGAGRVVAHFPIRQDPGEPIAKARARAWLDASIMAAAFYMKDLLEEWVEFSDESDDFEAADDTKRLLEFFRQLEKNQ